MKIIKLNSRYREQRQAYTAALALVIAIDAGLDRRCVHYRTVDGRLLTTLDEVVRAILDGTLRLAEAEMRRAA